MGDRDAASVWVLIDGACCVEWCMRLLLLLRPCVVPMLYYSLDYGYSVGSYVVKTGFVSNVC